ncbi:sulfatase [Halogeometricum luteum]|uniref:Sulfatase n=1 Tax=Halogeometricum luteum TaxID=2950537 RepID=A0ABU2FZG0_9EURY|nr:sulfatase [Halogeometricum sp. S3BR5-2]MDS0293927.1 sulfatase [Halogeometricum sp. S3BR5-2]
MSRPNVVVTVLDTVRGRDTVPASSSPMSTLGDIAASGTEFTSAFSAAPWTLPSHASLFTGTYPSQHGAHGDHTYLDDSLRTLPEAFRDDGYETVGVSNNTWITEEFGFHRGFDTLRKGWQYFQSDTDLGTVTRAEHPMSKLRAASDRLFDGNPLVNAANLVYDEMADGDGADRATSWVESWLDDRDAESPFFLFLNYVDPHVEYRPPREYAEQYLPPDVTYDEAMTLRQDPRAYDVGEYRLNDREFEILHALYRGALAYADDHLARVRDALVSAGEWEDTILVVLSDHGENVGDHGFFGHQYNLYDSLLHVPMVFHGGPFHEGRRDGLVQTLDAAPTLLDAAGVEAPEFRRQMHARSLHPDADSDPRDAVFAEYVAPQPSPDRLAARFDEIPDRVRTFDRSLRSVRTDDEKYVQASDGSEWFYRVGRDPDEAWNRASSNEERTELLSDRLDQWLDSFDREEKSGEVSMSDSTRDRLSDLGYL